MHSRHEPMRLQRKEMHIKVGTNQDAIAVCGYAANFLATVRIHISFVLFLFLSY